MNLSLSGQSNFVWKQLEAIDTEELGINMGSELFDFITIKYLNDASTIPSNPVVFSLHEGSEQSPDCCLWFSFHCFKDGILNLSDSKDVCSKSSHLLDLTKNT